MSPSVSFVHCGWGYDDGDTCVHPGYDHFGPYDRWYCFYHGMRYLDYLREVAAKEREDRCPDGPHCGCDFHRAGCEE